MLTQHAFLVNVELLTDFYYHRLISLDDSVYCAISDSLKGDHWNCAFSTSGQVELTSSRIRDIKGQYANLELIPSFILHPNQRVIADRAVPDPTPFVLWMSCEPSTLRRPSTPSGYEVVIAPTTPIDDLVTVFDGGCRNRDPSLLGYNSLPAYYTAAFRSGLESVDVSALACAFDRHGTLVALATGFQRDGYGCVYNVVVLPEHRRNGLGQAVTWLASRTIFDKGARCCFLQTQYDSSLPSVYHGIGYKDDFLATALTLPA